MVRATYAADAGPEETNAMHLVVQQHSYRV